MKAQIKALLKGTPILPGTLEKRYNVCGKAGCACKRKVNPRKHGPYYRLSYSIKGKNSSVFVPEEEAEKVKEMTDNYRRTRSVTQELALAMVESYRQNGLDKTLEQHTKLVDKEIRKHIGAKPESAVLKDTKVSRDKWKTTAKERHAELAKNKVTIRDLKASRNTWKEKAITSRQEAEELRQELAKSEKKRLELEEQIDNKKNF